jgi:ketosteroid isomerase-like protein
MKAVLCALLIVASAVADAAAPSVESALRQIDDSERAAILNEDLTTLAKLMSEDIIVNNPDNGITEGRDALFERVKKGLVRYDKFERTIDLVRVEGDIAFVMGGETVVRKGKTLHRRFTNVWRRNRDTWQLIARQASIVARD